MVSIRLSFVAALITAACYGGEPDLNPIHTRVFIVGVLKWQDSKTFASYPTKGRGDAELAEFFKGRGVFPEAIRLIQDSDATASGIRDAFKEFLSHSAKNETLFV